MHSDDPPISVRPSVADSGCDGCPGRITSRGLLLSRNNKTATPQPLTNLLFREPPIWHCCTLVLLFQLTIALYDLHQRHRRTSQALASALLLRASPSSSHHICIQEVQQLPRPILSMGRTPTNILPKPVTGEWRNTRADDLHRTSSEPAQSTCHAAVAP